MARVSRAGVRDTGSGVGTVARPCEKGAPASGRMRLTGSRSGNAALHCGSFVGFRPKLGSRKARRDAGYSQKSLRRLCEVTQRRLGLNTQDGHAAAWPKVAMTSQLER